MRLVLFMTRGMSLAAWEDNGSLERELALYAAFAQRGWTTTIVSWGGQRDKAIATRYPWLDVCVNQWGLSHAHYEYLMPVLHCRALWRADVIKSNQTNGADCAWHCARLWQKPFVARCGHMWSEFSRQQQHSDVQARAIEREVYTQCSRGIVTTKGARDFLVRAYGIDEQHVEIIYNYVTSTWYEAPLPPYHRPGSAVVTQVGRMAEQKNLPALIEACAGLPVTLRLVGDGPLREALRQHATTLGARVEFYGTVPSAELPRLLGESTVVTLVSHYEGQPRALVEAMARGCAVLGTRVRGIEELIEDGVNGLLCSTNAPSIRAGLERLLADAALRERLGTQAREYAQRFRLETIAAQELRLYTQLPTQGGLRKTGAFLGLVTRAAAAFCRVLRRKSLEHVKLKQEALLVQLVRHRLSPSDKVDCKSFFQKVLDNANESEKFALFTGVANAVGVAPHRLLLHLIKQHIADKSPRDALAFLLDFDSRLYTLCDECAVDCDNSPHTRHRHTHCHGFFIQRLGPGERVLDIGCGNGFLAWDMADKTGACVTSIELNSRNVDTTCQHFQHANVTHAHGDALQDLPAGEYDTVVLSNVLEHLPNRVDFLRKVRERLRPRRFLLRVPLFERDWRVPLKQELGVEWRLDVTHETEYSREQFLCELACAGLFVDCEEIRWGEIWCEASDAVCHAATQPAHPKVTVLMAVYNGARYLDTAITSILRQTYRDFVFLIVDDASTDATPAILKIAAARDARIQILTNTENLGLTASLNRGLEKVNTPYVARMDADDISLPERFARQLAFMETHPSVVACGCQTSTFTVGKDVVVKPQCPRVTMPAQVRKNTMMQGPQLSHSAAFIRADALRAVHGYRGQFTVAQDYDLWLRLLEIGDLVNLSECLLLYRSSSETISSVRTTEQAICHVLAMRSAECRRAALPDPVAEGACSSALLERTLDPTQASYFVWLRLLNMRPVVNQAGSLLNALALLNPCSSDQLQEAAVHLPHWLWRKVFSTVQAARSELGDGPVSPHVFGWLEALVQADVAVKISVIVPVYNDAPFLSACLGSLLGQTEQRVEIICVDDCSTDNSLECLRNHAILDKRIRVFAQTANQGAGLARNRGLQQARGEFVVFCDADDTMPSHALQRLLECAESNNVPVVCGNIAHMSCNMRLRVKGGVPASCIEKQEVVSPCNFPPLWLPWYHPRFLFRRSFLQKYGITYPNLLCGEDPPMLARVLCTAKRVGVIPDTVYNYRSAIAPKLMSTRALDDYLTSIRLVMEIYAKHGYMHQARLYLLFCLRSFLPESTVQLYGRKIHQSIMEHFAKLADQYGTAGDFAPYLNGQATLDAFSLARKGVAAQKIHKFKHALQRYFTKCRQA